MECSIICLTTIHIVTDKYIKKVYHLIFKFQLAYSFDYSSKGLPTIPTIDPRFEVIAQEPQQLNLFNPTHNLNYECE